MHYDSRNVGGTYRAGWGYIEVSSLPDTGVAGIIKKILNQAGESRLEFDCHGHYGCSSCQYAHPLIRYGSGSRNVTVEFTVTVAESGNYDTISWSARAAEDSSFSEPSYYQEPHHWEWEVYTNRTNTGTSEEPHYHYDTYAAGWVDGSQVYSEPWSFDQTAADHAHNSISNAISSGVREGIIDAIEEQIGSCDLNGYQPADATDIAYDCIGDVDVSFDRRYYDDGYYYLWYTSDPQIYIYAGGSAEQIRVTYLNVNKTIKDVGNYSADLWNLPAYNLTGTQFKIYSSATGGSPIADVNTGNTVMTVNSATGGTSNTLTLGREWVGKDVYIEETLPTAAVGFKKPTQRTKITLGDYGETKTASIENTPIGDPTWLKVIKKSNLNESNWVGVPELAGIQYELRYLDGNKAWIFTTDSNGVIEFNTDFASGSSFYTYTGNRFWPVGTYTLKEITTNGKLYDKGLSQTTTAYGIKVSPSDDGKRAITTVYTDTSCSTKAGNVWNNASPVTKIYEITERTFGVIEDEHWEPFAFGKVDSVTGYIQGDATLANAVFGVYGDNNAFLGLTITYEGHQYSMSGNKVMVDGSHVTITVGSNGIGTCPYPLPKKSGFYIQEITAPTGYRVSTSTYRVNYNPGIAGGQKSVTGFNGSTNAYSIEDSNGSVTEVVKRGSISLVKRDVDVDVAQGDATFANIKFAIVNSSSHDVTFGSGTTRYNPGTVVTVATTDSNGSFTVSGLAYGTYSVYELSYDSSLSAGQTYSRSAAAPSIYANNPTTGNGGYLVPAGNGNLAGTVSVHEDNTTVSVGTYKDEVVKSKIHVIKHDAEITTEQGDAKFAGIKYAIVNNSPKPIWYNGKKYKVGSVVDIITTNTSGEVTTGDLPYGTYGIYELRSDTGVYISQTENYNSMPKGTSIYANDKGYMYTSVTDGNVDPTDTSKFNVASQSEKTYIDNHVYDKIFNNAVSRGKLTLQKHDDDSDVVQGDASFENIWYAIVNSSDNKVKFEGNVYETGEVVVLKHTDNRGYFEVNNLPYGKYKVYELCEDHILNQGDVYTDAAARHTNAADGYIYANHTKNTATAGYLVPDNNLVDEAVIHPSNDERVVVTHVDSYDSIVRGDIRITKTDNEITEVQGDGSLAHIRYAIVNASNKPIKLKPEDDFYGVGDVIFIIETNEDGVATIGADYGDNYKNILPYGTYDIYELRSDSKVEAGPGKQYIDQAKGTSIYANNEGYLFTESPTIAKTTITPDNIDTVYNDYTVSSRQDSIRNEAVTYDKGFTNVISNGKLTVQKFDDDATEEQGDATFNDIKFAVVNRSLHPVLYEGTTCQPNTVVAVHETKTVNGTNGIAVFEYLPYGSYQVYELGKGATIGPNDSWPTNMTDPSLGDTYYAKPDDSYTLHNPGNPDRVVSDVQEIHPNNDNKVILIEDTIVNAVTRGTITITKHDVETNSTRYNGTYQGDTNFEGIRYAIVNRSNKFVKINTDNTDENSIYACAHGSFAPGEVVGIITTTKEGIAKYEPDGQYSLPYGRYDIYELRLDATINVGDAYDTSDKLGNSIWANHYGYLYTENPDVAEVESESNFFITKRDQAIRKDKVAHNHEFTNVPAKGTIVIQKNDGDLDNDEYINQGDGSLADIDYAVVNRSDRFIERNNVLFEPGEIIAIETTDNTGHVQFDPNEHYTFPYGTYEIIELRSDHNLNIHDIYDGNPNIGTSKFANEHGYVYTEDKTVAELDEKTTYTVDTRTHEFRDIKSTYEPTFTNYITKGTIVIHKEDAETTWAQGDEDFANIRYAIVNRSNLPIERLGEMYDVGTVVAVIATDHDGIAKLDEDGEYTLPYGKYEIFELRKDATIMPHDVYNGSNKLGESTEANSTGFMYTADVEITRHIETTSAQFTVASQSENVKDLKQTYYHTYKNAPAKGTLTLVKYDANLSDNPVVDNSNAEFKQGDANTEGIRYAVINVSKDPVTKEPRKVKYKGTVYNPNSIIDILTIKEENNYEARMDEEGEFSLNYGTYWVVELRLDCTLEVGDAYPVDEPDAPVLGTSIYSNENGYLHHDKYVLDKSALVTVTVDGNEEVDYMQYDVTTTEPVIHKSRTRFDYQFFNYPARGEILIKKFDDETNLQKNQGNNRFVGIKYAIVNKSINHVFYQSKIFEPGEIIDIVGVDEAGNVRLIDVPYGTYDIHELRRDCELEIGDIYPTSAADTTWDKLGTSIYANEWYTYCDDVFTKAINQTSPIYTVEYYTDSVRVAGETHTFNYSNMPIRSDFRHHKLNIDGDPIAFIPFAVSMLDDDGEILETHVVLTDKDGYLNTQTRPKNPATINSLDQYYDKEHGRYTGPLDDAAGEVNIWFGNIEDYYDPDVIANNRGSLLAGNYYVQELQCTNNEGQDMLRHAFDAFEERIVHEPRQTSVDLNIIMKSEAYDFGTESKTLSISTEAKVRDRVDITHLKTYNTYKLITEAVNVRTDGSCVSLGFSEPYIFQPEPYDETMTTYGTYDMICTFDTTNTEVGSYVGLIDRIYELVEGNWTEEPIRTHNISLKDESQKLYVPDITTSATNIETNSLIGSSDPNTAASDKIIYNHLGNNSFFNIDVTVVNKDGEVIDDVNGNPCRQSYFLYTNDTNATDVQRVGNVLISPTSGIIDMHALGLDPFVVADEYDTIGMVVTIYDATTGGVIMTHNTAMDEADEIIKYMRISTTASDNNGYLGIVPCGADAEITDIIHYENLVRDADVTVIGAVVDKTNGDIVTMATKKYHLTEGEGDISLVFEFDSTNYAGKELVVFERIYINNDGKEVLISKHEDLEDKLQTVAVPEIHTTLVNRHEDEDYKVVSTILEDVHLVDYVEYKNLLPGEPWTLTATLMDANTGEPVLDTDGNAVISTKTFTPTTISGVEEVEFTFKQQRKATTWEEDIRWVCFEDVRPGTLGKDEFSYFTHADIEDKNQTVFIPKFKTRALGKNYGKHLIKAAKNQIIVDTVEFKNFASAVTQGQIFTLTIEARDSVTGEPIVNDVGVPYTNTKTFVWNGQATEDIDITIDASNLGGKKIVFYETLYYGPNDNEDNTEVTITPSDKDKVLVEDDKDSEEQSVIVPDIHTMATDKFTNSHIMSMNRIITDKIMLDGLLMDTDYIIKTMMVDKETGEFIKTADGDNYVAITTYRSPYNKTSDTVEVSIAIDSMSDLEGKDIVMYEYLYFAEGNTDYDNLDETKLIAEHTDITDASQTLEIPNIHTTAVDANDGDHIIDYTNKKQTVIDTVEYSNLIVGEMYTITGNLVVKLSGKNDTDFKYVTDENGKPIEASICFVAETSDGTIDLTFTFDASKYASQTLVAFETLSYDNVEIAIHADINDEKQTVRVPKIRTLATDQNTNSHNLSANRVIVDKVMVGGIYENTKYVIKTMIVDKATGEFIKTKDGKDFEVFTEYSSPEYVSQDDINIVMDVSELEDLADKTIVVFEYLYLLNDKKISELTTEDLLVKHTDINDSNQTLCIPTIGTTAVDVEDGDHILDGTAEEQTIIDTVYYSNLIVGNEYTITGNLVVKPTADTTEYEYVTDITGNNILTSSVTFIAEESTGSIDIPFTFKPSQYAGKKLVAFETLSYKGVELAVHADINDEAQTTYVSLLLHVSIAKADFDNVGYFLKGAEITIFNADGSIARDINGQECVGLTDENGAVDFVVVYDENNIFYAQETKAPEGYQLCEDRFEIHPSDNKESLGTDLIKINILDEIIVIPPYTGDIMTIVAIATLGLGVTGLGVLLIIRHKKSKKGENE